MTTTPTEPEEGSVLAITQTYLDSLGVSSWTLVEVLEALVAEQAAQARVCRVPVVSVTTGTWPADLPDLLEALKRRTARALVMRPLPLGLQSTVSEAAVGVTRVGGLDAEIRRYEAPHRRVVLG